MKKNIIFLILSLFLGSVSAGAADAKKDPNTDYLEPFKHPKNESVIMGIPVKGGMAFCGRVDSALKLLKKKSYYDLQYVLKYIKAIEKGDRSVVSAYSERPTIYLKEDTLNKTSGPGLGAILVHEACHVEMRAKNGYGNPSYEAQQKEELECMAKEKETLKKLGGSEKEVQYIRRQDGLHFDTNKDGKYDRTDYEKQTW